MSPIAPGLLFPPMSPAASLSAGHVFRMAESALRAPPSGQRLPLQGVTVLLVEDSRYASDALRLMCQRSGARLRRAEDLTSAAAHLRCYLPNVVIVDIGLPDGNGAGLIAQISRAGGPLVLGTSGDPEQRGLALHAGARGFLEKPLPGLLAFQAAILAHLAPQICPPAGDDAADSGDQAFGDPMALADDLRQAAQALAANPPAAERAWLAGFLDGLARQAGDAALAGAAAELRDPATPAAQIAEFLRNRLQRLARGDLGRTEPPLS